MASLIAEINPNVKIMPLIVLNSQNNLISTQALVKAIQYAINEKVNQIVIAIYLANITSTINSLVQDALNENIAVITSSGNYGTCSCNAGKVNSLGSIKGVLTVGAIDQNLQRTKFSQFGQELGVVAPGNNITILNKTYAGTSMATALVSGTVSLLQNMNYNTSYVIQTLERTTTDLNSTGYDMYTGYGLINVSLALQTIQDREAPLIIQTQTEIRITDNVGLYKLITTDQTIQLHNLTRTINLKNYNYSGIIIAEDLAGNVYKVEITQKTHPLSTNLILPFVIMLIFCAQVKKHKRKSEK